jgi:hypothetical protein
VQPATVYLPERYGKEGIVVGYALFATYLSHLSGYFAAKREKQRKGDAFYETHHGAHAGYLGRASQGKEYTTVRRYCTLL